VCDQFQVVTFVTVTNCSKFEFVTEFEIRVFLLKTDTVYPKDTGLNLCLCFSFKFFLAKQVWSYFGHKCQNGHTFNCDWYNHVSVAVSIEIVQNERNTEIYTRK